MVININYVCLQMNVLLFLTSPITSAPTLLNVLSKFKQVSGLSINPHKSKALNISLTPTIQTQLLHSLPFTWSTTFISYLGINFTANPLELYTTNYPLMLSQLNKLLNNWSTIPLAWLGRIIVIKMSILTKLLYLFWVLPIAILSHFLRIIHCKILQFIWGKTKP